MDSHPAPTATEVEFERVHPCSQRDRVVKGEGAPLGQLGPELNGGFEKEAWIHIEEFTEGSRRGTSVMHSGTHGDQQMWGCP